MARIRSLKRLDLLADAREVARPAARPDVFEDLTVTGRHALVPAAASSGLAAAGSARQSRYLPLRRRIRRALAPGGVFAGQLFGTRDTWADDPDMTFHARHQAETLLDGLDILRLEETERDGHAFIAGHRRPRTAPRSPAHPSAAAVRETVTAFLKHRPLQIPGRLMRIMTRLTPRSLSVRMNGRMLGQAARNLTQRQAAPAE